MDATIDQVDRLVAEMSGEDQIEIARRISRRTRATAQSGKAPSRERRWTEQEVEEFLKDCDEIANSIHGEFDSAADINAMREERMRDIS